MTAPSLCGSFIGSKKSLLAFTWSVTTLLTFVAFLLAIIMVIQINSHYRYLERINDNGNNRYRLLNEDNNNNNEGDEQQHSGDQQQQDDQEEQNWYPYLAHTSSGAMGFVAMYTMVLATALLLYGSTAIVGFTSLRGKYIAPCFAHRNKLKVGIFGGAVVVFANLLLINAVIFGEFRVEDYRENGEREEGEPYAVERIATVLAVTCMILSVLYAAFAVLLFLTHASDNAPSLLSTIEEHDNPAQPLADRRHQQFITIEAT